MSSGEKGEGANKKIVLFFLFVTKLLNPSELFDKKS